MFLQKMSFKEPMKVSFDLDKFGKGLNNVDSSFNLPSGTSPNLLNVYSIEDGVLETRPGSFKYILEQAPEVIKKWYVYETATISCFILCSATKLYRVATTGGAYTELCTVTNVISGLQKDDKFYFVDGAKYREYDGTNVYEIINPTYFSGASTAVAASTITLPSTASAVDNFYNGWTIYISSGTGYDQTRTISGYVGSTKVATVSVAWTVQPPIGSGVYITNKPQGATEIDATNKTKMYVPKFLEFNDAFKGANNVDMIKLCKRIAYHGTLIWFACDPAHANIVYSTDVDNMYYSPVNTYKPSVTNDADVITGLYSFNNVLTIFKNRTVFALYGDDKDTYELQEVSVESGTINGDTIAKVDNTLFYLGYTGKVYALQDVRTDYKKMLSVLVSDPVDLKKEPIQLYASDWSDSYAIHYDKFYFLVIKDKILVYTGTGWFVWQGFAPTCMCHYGTDLLFTNSNKYLHRLSLQRFNITETFTTTEGQTDFILQKGYANEVNDDVIVKIDGVIDHDAVRVNNNKIRTVALAAGKQVSIEYLSMISYNDDGQSYDCYYHSPDMVFKYIAQVKQIRSIGVIAETFKYYTSTLNVDTYIDFIEIPNPIVINNRISLWGVARWGDAFITRNMLANQQLDINQRGKIIRFVTRNTCRDNPFRVYSINGNATVRWRNNG